MKTYYYRDPNGTIPSNDGKVMYSVLTGKQIIDFFSAAENKKRQFLKVSTNDDPNEVWFEVDPTQIHEARKDESRRQYVTKLQRNAGLEMISLESSCSPEGADDTTTFNEVISIESASPEDEFLKGCEIQDLQSAICELSKDERELVFAFYLNSNPKTEREYAAETGIPQTTVSYRKKATLKKLKKILIGVCSN